MSVSGNGGSSETVNARVIITDSVVFLTEDRENCTGLVMEIFSSNYRPFEKSGYTSKIISDRSGCSVALPAEGIYNFFIYSMEKKLSCFVHNQEIKKGSHDTTHYVLSSQCLVDGNLVSHDNAASVKYIVSVTGSPFVSITDETKTFSLGPVPRGTFTLTVRPKEQRLFISNAQYEFRINEIADKAQLNILLP
jgi:hypothetical protein